MALPDFKRAPSPILPILERLKQDPSEYVRRSVANNLNDISKDNPDLALDLANDWYDEHPDTDWIVKHASRTLLKQGDPRAMTLFGYAAPKSVTVSAFEVAKSVTIGDRLPSLLLSKMGALGKIRIEYGRKVFKISEGDIAEPSKFVEKSHSFKPITTHVYYPGEHKLEIIVNGVGMATKSFILEH